MSPSEGLAILELSEGADEAAVKEAYKRLSQQRHPDKAGGHTEAQIQLNHAYQAAMNGFSRETSLAIRTSQSVERLEAELSLERSARKAEAVAKSISIRRRRPLDKLRNVSLIVGLFAGVTLLFADYLLDPLLEPFSADARHQSLKVALGTLVVSLGSVALWMQTRIQSFQNSIESYVEELADRPFCAGQLAKVLDFRKDIRTISERDLFPKSDADTGNKTVCALLYRPRISLSDFIRLLLPKAVEHRLLKPVDAQEFETTYEVLFDPVLFQNSATTEYKLVKPISGGERIRKILLLGTTSMVFCLVGFFRLLGYIAFPSRPLGGIFIILAVFFVALMMSATLCPNERRGE